jgi:hypothetical protein
MLQWHVLSSHQQDWRITSYLGSLTVDEHQEINLQMSVRNMVPPRGVAT